MKIDLHSAFPPMEEGDTRAMMDAARSVQEEEKTMKRKIPTGILMFAMVTLLTLSVAVAETLGMFDFLQRHLGVQVLPGASSATSLAHLENEYVTFTIREAAFDGRGMSVLICMEPKDEKTFLLGEGGWTLEDAAAAVTGDESLGDMTLAEYLPQAGYDRAVTVGVDFPTVGDFSGLEESRDGVMTVLYAFALEGEQATVPFTCWTHPEGGEPLQAAGEITLTAEAPLWTAKVAADIDLPLCGMHLDRLTLTGTRLGMHADWTLTVTDLDRATRFISLRLVDETGVELRPGATGSTGRAHPQAVGEVLTASECLQPMQDAPTVLHLQIWDIESGETITIDLPVMAE